MSTQDNQIVAVTSDKSTSQVQKVASFPIDLAPAKISHVKSTIDSIKLSSVSQQSGTATFRAITGNQSSQVRVVMPPGATIMPQAMIKQIETNSTGIRSQITALPSRTISQASITVSRAVTPNTYVSRTVTNSNISSQRMITPLRTSTSSTVANLSGNFVRGGSVARNSASPVTTNATWMAAGTGQVQLIRTINHQPRQRLITQNITSSNQNTGNVVAVGQPTNLGNSQSQANQVSQSGQQTFVATLATVLSPRPQTATLVYSNVSNSQQQQQYNPNVSAQRFTVAASLSGNQRQMRPIQLGNRTFSTAKIGVGTMNATNISIRAPNIPVLTPTLANASNVTNLQARTTTANVTTNMSATRIIQLQQPQTGSGAQQIIGSSGRIASNLMLQPIIMNSTTGSKIGIRPATTLPNKVQPSLTITQLGLSKLAAQQTSSGTNVSISTSNIQNSSISLSSTNSSNPTTQSETSNQPQSQSVNINIANQTQNIAQIVSVNQGVGTNSAGQIIAQSVHVPSSATVVPLGINSRSANVLAAGTITPIKPNTAISAVSIPSTAKILSQQGLQSQKQTGQQTETTSTSQQSHQTTSVFIQARPQSGGSSASTTVIPNNGTFLPAGNTFYYESVPASSVSISTGVISLTTTTATNAISSNLPITSTNLSTSLVSSIPYTPSASTFTVVQSNRQIQVTAQSGTPSSHHTSQIQNMPLRFNQQTNQDQTLALSGQNSITQVQNQKQQEPQILQQNPQHSIIAIGQSQHINQQQQSQCGQQTHMLIPVQTPIKLQTSNTTPSARIIGSTSTLNTIASAFLRKRNSSGSPIRAAKNLGPTFLSMGSNKQLSASINERLKEKENPTSPPTRPGSSEGSTTVSANSSPGIDQQISEEINMRITDDSYFNPINEYTHHQDNSLQNNNLKQNSGGNIDNMDKESNSKARILNVDNQPIIDLQSTAGEGCSDHRNSQENLVLNQNVENDIFEKMATNITISNKENKKPTDIIIKKPKSLNLLDTYKLNWKAANNHFQRYSDVKPREERRPTVMDLANQAHVVQKINGWKIHHLSAQMEDLCEIETQMYNKLTEMLQQIESHVQTADTDRVNDLIKGNMQRSKIVVDGVNEARTQILKIFDHKAHVSDIILRCASKRNFKKREKP